MPALRVCAAVAAASVAACAAPTSAPSAPDPREERERADVRAHSPRAAELLGRGDALFAAGQFEQADALFREARAAYADGPLPWRRDCEARTRIGPRADAVLACAEALERGRSDATVRAMVSAFVDGPVAPRPGDLFEAMTLIARERHNPLGQVTAAAATCDVAERIGDGVMLERCAADLERLAPGDPAARAARAALASRCPPWRFWLGWGLLAAAAAVTALDALRGLVRRLRARNVAIAPAAMALALASTLGAARVAHAEEPPAPRANLSHWPIDAEHPDRSIPSEKDRNAQPLEFGYWLQDVALRAEHASKDGDHAAAARFYAALGQAVPDRAVAFAKACQELEAAGDLDHAISACGDAILRDGATVADYSRFVTLTLSRPGNLRPKEVIALGQVLTHMRQDPASAGVVDDLECQVGTRTSNVSLLEECTANLSARSPDDARTITYLWALAVEEGRLDDAQKLGERARAAGVPAEQVAAMEQVAKVRATKQRWHGGLTAAAVVLFLAALGIAGGAFARRRQGAPAGASPAGA